MKYKAVYENEPFIRDLKVGWRIACCDCGKVHFLDFKQKKGYIFEVTVICEERRTAQLRRHKNGALHGGVRGWKLIRNED